MGKRRMPSPAVVIGAGAVLVALTGTASAATGGSFILGHDNSATTTTTLTDSHGTPLALVAGGGAPPLRVNSSKRVPNLNASEVGGLAAKQLQRRITGTCPTGSAIQSVAASGKVTCVAVSTGSNGPTSPSEATSKGWALSQLQVSTAPSGDFQAVARLTNDNAKAQDADWSVTLFNGQQIVGSLFGSEDDVGAGDTFTVQFSSGNPVTTYTSWTFQTDFTEDS